ncbi:hypothetical protein CKAH01_11653 [Colletotrichum kahawae]|uniref:N-acetyltransferase domain-containing protein n=1 Tax=Colletotrichum kahawae TaxID=34407 RepID=A0AAE0DC54_COLKA|nr:hypothetical protein CKAH01_11653 [Colletotrichum kahawae]
MAKYLLKQGSLPLWAGRVLAVYFIRSTGVSVPLSVLPDFQLASENTSKDDDYENGRFSVHHTTASHHPHNPASTPPGREGGGFRGCAWDACRRGGDAVHVSVETEVVAERSRSVERIRMMMRTGMFSFAIFYIFARESWGRGYATEALKTFLEEYWGRFPGGLKTEAGSGLMGETKVGEMEEEEEGRHFLEAHVHDGNVGSVNVLQKCGFEVVREGKTMAHGVEVGTQIYQLNRPR